jgi:hypothetical protein
MNDIPSGKPSGKILFGVDYLTLMKNIENPNENEPYEVEKAKVVEAAIKLFLLQWDFSVEEVNEAIILYKEKIDTNTLDEKAITVIDRVVNFLKEDKNAQEKFLIEMAAVSQMDNTFLEVEKDYLDFFQSRFDFRPSEMQQIYKKGRDWGFSLDYFGEVFVEYKNQAPNN